jgi:SNF2 family DNA or RNA helicase
MIYDAQRNVVVYNVAQPDRFLYWVDGARQLHNGYVAAPATLANLQRIRGLGLPIMAPMRDYDWPHGPAIKGPMHAQRVTANFLVAHPHSLCLSDPGTGKTLAALWAADYLMSLHSAGNFRAIVVAPLSILQDQWANEIFQHFMGRRSCVVVYGSAEKREKLLSTPADFYIINHDGVGIGARLAKKKMVLGGLSEALAARVDIRLAIVDEASAYRDAQTRRSRLARRLLSTRDYCWGLTGTPTPQGPLDAYGIAKLINGAPGWTKTAWRGHTMMQLAEHVWRPKVGSHKEAQKLLQPAVRFSLDDCVDLPEMVVQTRDVEPTAEQVKAFRDFKRDLVLELKDKKITAANEAVARMKFIQIAAGMVYDKDHVAHHIDCRSRIAVLKEAIDESNDKIIVFAPLTSVVHMLHMVLSKDYTVEMITGEVGFKERNAVFDRFKQTADPRILVADPGTMSHGLNLTVAKSVLWYAPKDNTEIYLQANRRIRRPGQNKPQRIVHLVCHKIEREIYRRLLANETMQGLMLKLVEEKE